MHASNGPHPSVIVPQFNNITENESQKHLSEIMSKCKRSNV